MPGNITNFMDRLERPRPPTQDITNFKPNFHFPEAADCQARDSQVRQIYKLGGFLSFRPEDRRMPDDLRRRLIEWYFSVHKC